MIQKPGRQPNRSEQLLLQDLVKKACGRDNDNAVSVIVHHITEDTPHKLQLEVEWQIKNYSSTVLSFERIFL